MADGLNQARAMRVAEIVQDFRTIQNYFASLRVSIPRQDANLEGYLLLRQCIAESQQLLAQPYQATSSHPRGDAEKEKSQLRQLIMDAGLRRHRAQKLYMRAVAAQRWIASRNALLQGRQARPEHARGMAQISQAFRNEVAGITDARVEYAMRASDTSQGKWLAEDPSLAVLVQLLRPGSRR